LAFRAAFDCLWCGRSWVTRRGDDLEGWAQLCVDCLGRAQDNGFLRFRLKSALADRGRGVSAGDGPDQPPPDAEPEPGSGEVAPRVPVVAAAVSATATSPAGTAPTTATEGSSTDRDDLGGPVGGRADRGADDADDRYLRRGRWSRGPVRDLAWQLDMDAATAWLDGLALDGDVLELAAGTGWWSPILAQRGSLTLHDADGAALDRARARLLAHGLRAHLHVREPWAEPDRAVDAVFCALALERVPPERLVETLRLVARWLRPAGRFAFIEATADPEGRPTDARADGSARAAAPALTVDVLRVALTGAGFRRVTLRTTSRFFILGEAER
jgi:SAM-dependent methyltransferase